MFEFDVKMFLAALASMAIGMAWYSPFLFAKKWMALVGKTQADLKGSGTGWLYVMSFVGNIVMAFVLSQVLNYIGVNNWSDGLKIGMMMWLGFVVPTSAMNHFYSGRPKELYFIDTGYHLVNLMVMGAVLAY